MSTLEGGIFSRPRGKTGGVVFGAARTRAGKLVTSRLLVSPSNPNSSAQQVQRGIFSSAQAIVRQLGSSVYQTDWNRSVGQLPGFQSMQSIFMNQMASDLTLALVNDINLGVLPDVGNLDANPSSGVAGITYTWDAGQASPATAADVITVIAIASSSANRALDGGIVFGSSVLRSAESYEMDGLIEGVSYQYYFYIRGAGTAEGLLSVASAGTATSGTT